MQNNDKKFKTVIDKNTFYFYNPVFQEKYESYTNSLKETLLVLKNKIETDGLKKDFIESSFLKTTSSGQGDKAKTEANIKKLISRYYPKATFVGFVDGIGWYVRKQDLARMVSAFDDVFTFHKDEIERFKQFLKQERKKR